VNLEGSSIGSPLSECNHGLMIKALPGTQVQKSAQAESSVFSGIANFYSTR
jgi:hypothetical protein